MVSWGARDLLEDVDITSDLGPPSQCLTAGLDWQLAGSTNQITIFRAGYRQDPPHTHYVTVLISLLLR